MNPITLANGRSEILFDPRDGMLRMRLDGYGLLQMLSKEDRVKLSKALWYSAKLP